MIHHVKVYCLIKLSLLFSIYIVLVVHKYMYSKEQILLKSTLFFVLTSGEKSTFKHYQPVVQYIKVLVSRFVFALKKKSFMLPHAIVEHKSSLDCLLGHNTSR